MISKKVELKLKRVKLIQSGQKEAANEVLREYWDYDAQLKNPIIEVLSQNDVDKTRETVSDIVDETPKDVIEEKTEEKVVKKHKFNSIDDLVKIKGIGKETAKDIKKIYKTMDKLVKVLNNGENLPLRNDIAKKIRKELI